MWPTLAATFFALALAVHLLWRRKYLAALKFNEAQLARIQEVQSGLISAAEAQQTAVLNSMIEGVLLLDNEGRIRLANRALEKFFGVTANIYGKTIIEAFRNHELAELVSRLKTDREIVDFELQLSEIQPRWLQVNAARITNAVNESSGSILVFHDLTRLRQLENTRQEFVANVSHELRTPLSMIKGYVETLLDGAKDDPEVAVNFLRIIEKHADRLTFLIDDLLTISKLESGQITLSCEDEALRPAVEKVLQNFAGRAAEKGMKLENAVPPEMRVVVDLARLEQVFGNLIDNAIKYSHSDGSVTIGARVTENEVVVWVKDTGPGIPPEARERVFERFFRVDKGRSRGQGGTGLGLAIVKHVVQSHGGTVWIESEMGKGSVFSFSLPRVAKPAQS